MFIYILTRVCDFNPRSHERSDIKHCLAVIVIQISIHAPTRGATLVGGTYSNGSDISIHAPTRGATVYPVPVGAVKGISIHAPTRGATTQVAVEQSGSAISIHAPTRGATMEQLRDVFHQIFQSTLPREERR